MSDFLNELFEKFKSEGISVNGNNKLSDEEKFRILGIDETQINYIKNLEYRNIGYDDSDYETDTSYEEIELKNLIGSARGFSVKNWIELLLSIRKQINFEKFKSKAEFEQYIELLKNSTYDLPIV